jgi:hypothetical protein
MRRILQSPCRLRIASPSSPSAQFAFTRFPVLTRLTGSFNGGGYTPKRPFATTPGTTNHSQIVNRKWVLGGTRLAQTTLKKGKSGEAETGLVAKFLQNICQNEN